MSVNPPRKMAAGRVERGSRGDDDGHSTRMPSLWCVVVVAAAAVVILDGVCNVQGAPTPTNDTMIVAKTLLAGQWSLLVVVVEQAPKAKLSLSENVCLFVRLSLSVRPSVCLFVCLSVCLW